MSPAKKFKPKTSLFADYHDRFWLGLALVVGAVVRFVDIAKSSIWHDEGYTMMLAPQSPGQILMRTGRDVHPPLYYLTLHYWMQLFGSSETAARGMSATFMLGTIVVSYLLVKRLFGSPAARLAAIFVALGPFLVRYSQEARMYGMVAFLLATATWLLVKAVQDGKRSTWILYGLVIAAALYTHYYAIFVIALHWIYMLVETLKPSGGLRKPTWWVANVIGAGLFLPWLPVAYHQFTRVQASFWIPPVGVNTLPATMAQFLTFTDMGAIPLVRTAIFVALFAATASFIWLNRGRLSNAVLIIAFAAFGPLAVFLLSYKRPIYVDRYFVFAAVGFYALLAVLHYHAWPWLASKKFRLVSIAIVLVTFGVGIRDVYAQANHRMRDVAAHIASGYQPGDDIVSGELYTYFDYSYYNHTGYLTKLLAPDGVNGYGESSLLYDRADQIVVHNLADLHPADHRVWVVGKTGPHDYFDKVPANWTPVGSKFESGYVATQLYSVR